MKALRFHYSLPRIVASKMLGGLYSSAYVGALAPLKFEETAEPALPADDWVKVRTRLAGVCGSDLKQVLLKGSWDNPMTALVSFPHVLGHEAVGIVEETGSQVRNLKVGQRVLLDPWLSCKTRGIDPPCQPCAEGDYTCCRNFDAGGLPAGIHIGNNAGAPGAFAHVFTAHESQCFAVPDGVSDEAAVLGDPFSVSLHSVLRAPPVPGAPVLVYGLGTLGQMAIAAVRRLHPDTVIYGVGKYAHQCELALKMGANEVMGCKPIDVIERVAELTGAKLLKPWSKVPWLMDGVGVVYDTVGSPETVETSIRIAQARGSIVVSGVEAPKRFEWTPIYFKEVSVIGSNAFAVEDFTPVGGGREHAMDYYLRECQKGMDLTSIITHRFPLEDWRQAFRALFKRGASGAVKVVLNAE